MKKFFLLPLIIIFLSCGIEDTIYFKEPAYISVEYDITNNPVITFYGFNQESPDGEPIFVGYDLFYYFDVPEKKKRAVVQNYYQLKDRNEVIENKNRNLLTSADLRGARKLYDQIPSLDAFYNIYQLVTFPVTEEIINKVLYEANTGNVSLYFHNKYENDLDFSNPFYSVTDSKVFIDNIYPGTDDYPDDYEDIEGGFKGFLDPEYYKKKIKDGVVPIESTALYDKYRVYMYLVAKGFDSLSKTSFTNFTDSVNSSTITVNFTIEK